MHALGTSELTDSVVPGALSQKVHKQSPQSMKLSYDVMRCAILISLWMPIGQFLHIQSQ